MQSAANGSMSLIILGETNVQKRKRPADAFRHVSDALKDADVVIGHLEGLLYPPSSDPGNPDAPFKPGWYHSDPAMAEALKDIRIRSVSNASNVSYGQDAVLNTVRILDEMGIAHAGIGANRNEAHKPGTFEHNGIKFGTLAYTSVFWPSGLAAGDSAPGAATIKAHTFYGPGPRAMEMPGAPPIVQTKADSDELQKMIDDVRALRPHVDILIGAFHWGVSSQSTTVDYQKEIAHAAIDAGADIVLGYHPHVVQAAEIYKGKPICYSLGNFAFDWWKMEKRNLDGIALKCSVENGKIARIDILPSRRNRDNDVEWLAADSKEGQEIIGRLKSLSEMEFGTFPGAPFRL